MKNIKVTALLIFSFLVYSSTCIFTKLASGKEFLSLHYILLLAGAVAVLALYAFLWQQILKRMDVSDAYQYKGLSIIFTLLFCHFIFGEEITLLNGIGALIIVGGIALNAKS